MFFKTDHPTPSPSKEGSFLSFPSKEGSFLSFPSKEENLSQSGDWRSQEAIFCSPPLEGIHLLFPSSGGYPSSVPLLRRVSIFRSPPPACIHLPFPSSGGVRGG